VEGWREFHLQGQIVNITSHYYMSNRHLLLANKTIKQCVARFDMNLIIKLKVVYKCTIFHFALVPAKSVGENVKSGGCGATC